MNIALTIAGSDSGGGAGIQADLKTFAAHGVFGTTAITAITAQNTHGVTRVLTLPADVVLAQIEAVVTDLRPGATKIGMLGSVAVAAAVADLLARLALPHLVLDPVMVAKGGARLVDDAGMRVIRDALLPLASVVTANVPEAETLTGMTLRTTSDLREAATRLVALGAAAAIVKGGHLEGPAIDVFYDGQSMTELYAERVVTPHTHGTGCTFAAAIAARLACGDSLRDAAATAKAYVTRAIQQAPGLGHGHGPLQHFPR